MSKLWIFGDSYGALTSDQYNDSKEWHWISVLSKTITTNKVVSVCHHGASNEWIFLQFREHISHIAKDDLVIVISTNIDRRWFFYDNVGASNLNVLNASISKLSKEQKNAVEQYLLYLRNPVISPLLFDQFCNSLHYIAEKNKFNLLILPGFEEKGFPISGKYSVTGSLFDVCKNEIRGKTVEKWAKFISTKHNGDDPRIGHLSEINHLVLANKLINTFQTGQLLDLNTGFHEEILAYE
jgi:hypothetical protein